MDVPAEVQRLRLDLLAVEVSEHLTRTRIPHALIKGPSTSVWLYDPPRPYADVDVLVPYGRVRDVITVLEDAGVATAKAGQVGEEASHSLLMISRLGMEVDVHISLPTLPASGDLVWQVLEQPRRATRSRCRDRPGARSAGALPGAGVARVEPVGAPTGGGTCVGR